MADVVKVNVDYKVNEGILDSINSQEFLNVLSDAFRDALGVVAAHYDIPSGDVSITSVMSNGVRNADIPFDGAERKYIDEKTNVINYGTLFHLTPDNLRSQIAKYLGRFKSGRIQGH